MPEARPLRCGVVGAGRMGMVHGHLLQVYPGTELVGFADPHSGAAGRLARQGLRAPVHATVAELLEAASPDAVFVCTPTHTHHAVVVQALARPVHLFVEKPVATTVAEADAIRELAQKRQVMHAAGYVYAHLPVVEEARRLVALGVLGDLLRFHAHAYISEVFGPKSGWFFQREQSGGGVVANMGSHVLFILGWMFGRPRRVMATTRSHASEVDDSAQALLWFESGLSGMLDASWSMPGAQMLDYGLTVDGRQGTLVLERERILLHLLRPAAGFPAGWSEIHASALPADTAFDISPHIGGEAFYRQLRVFETACRTGTLPFCSLDEACHTQRMIEGIYTSAAAGEPVDLS
ncbi:MAG TPA: Gfo/Idh/MocA family oxidoreductase [Vicinamibacteria bacterium]|nr:Gfo/Idh/MocA family oxidoreductase [Vicinamibacteria bacterium]